MAPACCAALQCVRDVLTAHPPLSSPTATPQDRVRALHRDVMRLSGGLMPHSKLAEFLVLVGGGQAVGGGC